MWKRKRGFVFLKNFTQRWEKPNADLVKIKVKEKADQDLNGEHGNLEKKPEGKNVAVVKMDKIAKKN